MKNKMTTIGGYILIGGAVLTLIGTGLTGGDIMEAWQPIAAMFGAGAVGVMAADGGP